MNARPLLLVVGLAACAPPPDVEEPPDRYESCTGPGGRWEATGTWFQAGVDPRDPLTREDGWEGTLKSRFLDPDRMVEHHRFGAEGDLVYAQEQAWVGEDLVYESYDRDLVPGVELEVLREVDPWGRETSVTFLRTRQTGVEVTHVSSIFDGDDRVVQRSTDEDGDGVAERVTQWEYDDAGRTTSAVTYDGATSAILVWWVVEILPGEGSDFEALWRREDREGLGDVRRVSVRTVGEGQEVTTVDHGDDGVVEVRLDVTFGEDDLATSSRLEIDGAAQPPAAGERIWYSDLLEVPVFPGLADGVPDVVQESTWGLTEILFRTDTNGDGEDDWVTQVTLDDNGFVSTFLLREGDEVVDSYSQVVRCVR